MSLTPFRGFRARAAARAVLAAAGLGLVCSAASIPAHAALGDTISSVHADRSAMRGQLVATPLVNYDVQEITSGELVVREYVTRAGQVFAVSWQGPTLPDLSQLLGRYFARFQSAALAQHQVNPGIHRVFTLKQSDLVILSTGRLRAFHGIAYLPTLVPSGVSVDQLQ